MSESSVFNSGFGGIVSSGSSVSGVSGTSGTFGSSGILNSGLPVVMGSPLTPMCPSGLSVVEGVPLWLILCFFVLS